MFDPHKAALEIVAEPHEESGEKDEGGSAGKHAFIAMMEAARAGDFDTAWEAFEAAVAACESEDDPEVY